MEQKRKIYQLRMKQQRRDDIERMEQQRKDVQLRMEQQRKGDKEQSLQRQL